MILQTIKNLITEKDKGALYVTAGFMKSQGRLIFYNAAIETGLLNFLQAPSTLEQIAAELKIADRQLLESLLDLGCALKELSCKKGKYALKGTVAKALITNIPIRELVRETVQYHADVALRLGTYLLKNKKGDYIKECGGMIAESSRVMEPMIKAFIYHSIDKLMPLKILEAGCGTGEYLKYYVDINSSNRGVAIDINASAVAIARKKIKENKIDKNFTVLQDNIFKPQKIKGDTFDLVTSYSNIYYFSDDQRKKLFVSILKLLKDNGRFMLATSLKTKNLATCYYDILFSATRGLYPLPVADELISDLKAAGFKKVKVVNVFGDAFKGFVAYK